MNSGALYIYIYHSLISFLEHLTVLYQFVLVNDVRVKGSTVLFFVEGLLFSEIGMCHYKLTSWQLSWKFYGMLLFSTTKKRENDALADSIENNVRWIYNLCW